MITVEILEKADRRLGYFDELEVGQSYHLGSTRISRASALAFAKIFDPFYFHVDEEAAKRSIFGGTHRQRLADAFGSPRAVDRRRISL